jgi:RNA polymerase sigma-70 factor, ECF subfamily
MSDGQVKHRCRMSDADCDKPPVERQDETRQTDALPRRADDELLLEYARSGEQPVFEEIVHRYERKIYSYLRKYLGDDQMAEDAFQATFLQVHLKCRQFTPGRRFSPWLYRIATNQATDLLRRNRRHRAVSLDVVLRGGDRGKEQSSLLSFLEDGGAMPGRRLESTEERQRVRSALERLPQATKQLLVLVKCQGMKYHEVAELLGIPLGTVKSRMNEAVRRLHNALVVPAPVPVKVVR